jgi:hypothetical protein
MEKLSAARPANLAFAAPRNPRLLWSSLSFARNFASGLPASLKLSLTPAKRLKLELAKGFEPLTL